MNLNKVFLIGRLTIDPEIRTIPSGEKVTSFGVATNRTWTDKSGNRKEATEFHNVVLWGRQAEIVSQFLKKGSVIFIEGRLQTRSWQGKDGVSRRTTEIIGERVQLGPRAASQGPSEETPEAAPESVEKPEEMPVIDLDEEGIKPEDLPF
ncbi:MAG TPA: single-stranded DNA-binding protein [Candidatus Colwellbacteria bacterium]|nr:single-stranded DNA-binding protein [Candidatus Colwellbacteria bacterium]HQA96226.1 single-stranded DNA-binding protein [Candidatus Colwellbacteria bacterium]